MTCGEHIKCHEQEDPDHIEGRIAQEAFESEVLSTGERSRSIICIRRVLRSALKTNSEHHVESRLVCARMGILDCYGGTWAQVIMLI